MKKQYRIVMTGGGIVEVEGTLFNMLIMPKHSFGIRKEKDYVVDHINSGRSLGIHAKTEKDAIKQLTEILSDAEKKRIVLEAPDLDTTLNAFKEFQDNRIEFENLTGIKVPISPLYGLDIIALDKKLNPPENVSLAQHLENKYGKRARELINNMLNCEPAHYGVSYGAIAEWLKHNW